MQFLYYTSFVIQTMDLIMNAMNLKCTTIFSMQWGTDWTQKVFDIASSLWTPG